MTYQANGRSLAEVLLAVTFAGFLTGMCGVIRHWWITSKCGDSLTHIHSTTPGFVTVLCIGNYYRAKRAMERQRRRRLNVPDSPRSSSTVSSGGEQQALLLHHRRDLLLTDEHRVIMAV